MIKVRYTTWYWGNYCLANPNEELPEGFEIYNEDLHGWKNSDEYKIQGKEEPYPIEVRTPTLKEVANSSYIQNHKARVRSQHDT